MVEEIGLLHAAMIGYSYATTCPQSEFHYKILQVANKDLKVPGDITYSIIIDVTSL